MELPNQVYRASIGALIFNDKDELLLISTLHHIEEWDFVKGGMDLGEDELDTLKREMGEEVGSEFKYEIVDRSHWYLIYTWTPEKQKVKGVRGQARISYWVKYLGGEFKLQADEVKDYKWVHINDCQRCC